VLGYNTSYVGNVSDGQPNRGSSDELIVEHSLRTNQIIVTSNHDMMLICAEAGQRFVWLDPRGRQLTRAEQVLLVFSQIDEWQQILEEQSGMSIRALRTRSVAIESAEAARLARRRMRDLHQRRQRRTSFRAKQSEGLDLDR
jgi:hypothetical protein